MIYLKFYVLIFYFLTTWFELYLVFPMFKLTNDTNLYQNTQTFAYAILLVYIFLKLIPYGPNHLDNIANRVKLSWYRSVSSADDLNCISVNTGLENVALFDVIYWEHNMLHLYITMSSTSICCTWTPSNGNKKVN